MTQVILDTSSAHPWQRVNPNIWIQTSPESKHLLPCYGCRRRGRSKPSTLSHHAWSEAFQIFIRTAFVLIFYVRFAGLDFSSLAFPSEASFSGFEVRFFAGSDFLVHGLFPEILGSGLNFLIASETFKIPALRAAALVEGLVGSNADISRWRT